ncbi:MAG: carboxy terminal-processing peptidase [Gammaproteobacteria bacterium]|nr:carboxy terminal-processing peptidase [Gammaproteobacteria bacterium]
MNRLLAWLLLTAPAVFVSAAPPLVTDEELQAWERHDRAALIITHIMDKYHYRKEPLDDVLSSRILDSYLESLDGNRSFFLQKDITDFERYRYLLDEAIEDPDLEPAYAIFKVYRQRVDERSAYARSVLEGEFDFSIDEDYMFDRRESDWAQTEQELNAIWRKKVKNDYLMLLLADKEDDEIKEILGKRYVRFRTSTFQLNSNDVFQSFINAYTIAVEPHTFYFTPRSSENFDITMRLSLEGIGAVLRAEQDYTVVQRIIPGGPAELGGQLQASDKITGVGQGDQGEITDVVGWRLDDVVDMIRGPKGSVVRLEILSERDGFTGNGKIISITRDEIRLEEQAAQSEVIDLESGGQIGVITVPAFYSDFPAQAQGKKDYRSTTRDVRRLLAGFKEKNLDGLLIDLRGNGGGSLLEALELTGLFIESGPIIQTRDYSGKIEINSDPDPDIAYGGPLAVLVNRNSASASEIFAGAIQDYRRGIIIGEPTFGKGTVQNIIDLNHFTDSSDEDHGRLKATIAQFFRISGGSNQHRGVIPDIIFPTARFGQDYGERVLDNALPWDEVKPLYFMPVSAPVESFARARELHEQRIKDNRLMRLLLEDMETAQAMENKKTVSLQDSKRKAEREERRLATAELRNEYRVTLGLEPVPADAVDIEDEDKLEDLDPLLDEAARILFDLVVPVRQAIDEFPDTAKTAGITSRAGGTIQ